MKTHFLFLWGMLMLFCACNEGVFVDRISPSVNGVCVPSDGSTTCIDLGTGDWSIYSVSTSSQDVHGDVYDLEGNLLSQAAPMCSGGLVRMVSRHPLVDFVIERSHSDELKLTVRENPGGKVFPLSIVVGNQYETRTIDLSLQPSEAYRLDSISYILYSYGVRDSLLYTQDDETVVVHNNHSEQSLQWTVYPYLNARAFVKFNIHGEESLELFGADKPLVHIPVPSRLGLFLSDEAFALSPDYIPVPVSDKLNSISETVTIPPLASMSFTTKRWYQWKSISCDLYATHPRTGRKRHLDVLCERVDPIGYTLYHEAISE